METLSNLVWVTVGKTEHPAWLLKELDESSPTMQVRWQSTGRTETVLTQNIKKNLRGRRRTCTAVAENVQVAMHKKKSTKKARAKSCKTQEHLTKAYVSVSKTKMNRKVEAKKDKERPRKAKRSVSKPEKNRKVKTTKAKVYLSTAKVSVPRLDRKRTVKAPEPIKVVDENCQRQDETALCDDEQPRRKAARAFPSIVSVESEGPQKPLVELSDFVEGRSVGPRKDSFGAGDCANALLRLGVAKGASENEKKETMRAEEHAGGSSRHFDESLEAVGGRANGGSPKLDDRFVPGAVRRAAGSRRRRSSKQPVLSNFISEGLVGSGDKPNEFSFFAGSEEPKEEKDNEQIKIGCWRQTGVPVYQPRTKKRRRNVVLDDGTSDSSIPTLAPDRTLYRHNYIAASGHSATGVDASHLAASKPPAHEIGLHKRATSILHMEFEKAVARFVVGYES